MRKDILQIPSKPEAIIKKNTAEVDKIFAKVIIPENRDQITLSSNERMARRLAEVKKDMATKNEERQKFIDITEKKK